MKRRMYLHATEPDAERTRCGVLALGDLLGAFLRRGVIPVLPRAHLQVKHARPTVQRRYVLHHQEIYQKCLLLSKK